MTLDEYLATVRETWQSEMDRGVARAEANHVAQALDAAGMGGMALAAEILGVTVPELRALIDRHGLTPQWRRSG